MQQRDYLKDQIEQLGKVLAQLLAKVMGFEGEPLSTSLSAELEETYSGQLDMDLDDALKLDDGSFRQELIAREWHHSHLETFARTLLALSKNDVSLLEKKNLLQKALIVTQIMEVQSRSISFQQIALVEEIQAALKP